MNFELPDKRFCFGLPCETVKQVCHPLGHTFWSYSLTTLSKILRMGGMGMGWGRGQKLQGFVVKLECSNGSSSSSRDVFFL